MITPDGYHQLELLGDGLPDTPSKEVVDGGYASCRTEYVRAVTVDELYAFLYQQSCELHDFLQSARKEC